MEEPIRGSACPGLGDLPGDQVAPVCLDVKEMDAETVRVLGEDEWLQRRTVMIFGVQGVGEAQVGVPAEPTPWTTWWSSAGPATIRPNPTGFTGRPCWPSPGHGCRGPLLAGHFNWERFSPTHTERG